ncbi:acid protease [Rickenella mellea]|uniref:Acid protease n=1 Tax=Rickenella mellea TaxID=50990 RepID=A0A4V3AZR8_9AGAM|nr:acid protease [Rickenella mellea]
MLTTLLLIISILDAHIVQGLKFPVQIRTTTTSLSQQSSSSRLGRHVRRTGVTAQTVNTSNGSIPIANTQNAEYISNITLGGVTIPVMLDTGSSDLWVSLPVPNARDSGKTAKLEYAVGEASGHINFAPLTFDNYTVPDQAFLQVTNTSSFTTDISKLGFNGLLGLGPNSGSVIRKGIKSDNNSGDSLTSRIFQQNRTTSNFISFLLDRQGDPADPFTGQITISEYVTGFENIAQAPKLPILKVPGLTDADQHWQILTDKDTGVIGPDGQPIQMKSIVPKAPDGQYVAVLDSGFTLPQVPRKMSDAIYGRVPGAAYNEKMGIWTIPCDALINLSLNFGGQNYPIHPLDVSSSDFALTDANGKTVCAGTFQPITSAFSLLGEYDIILGMGFLRNTYTLIDYGNFVDDTSNDLDAPFVQLLSVTDVTKAHADFVKVRLNGVDTSGDAAHALLPASQGLSSPESAAEKKQHLEGDILRRWPYILLGCLVLVASLVGLVIWKCCCGRWRAKRQAKKERKELGDLPLSATKSPYRSLHDPRSVDRF